MTKERELLRRALENWDASHCDPIRTDGLMEEIRAHLAAEEEKQEEEPVAFKVVPRYEDCDGYFDFTDNPEAANQLQERGWTIYPLFLHPSPQAEQRKPLSKEEIDKGYEDWMSEPSWACFVLGVRFAEAHHGIGEGDD